MTSRRRGESRWTDRRLRYHFSGLAGARVNPLAQLMAARGHHVQGSDRSFDRCENQELAARVTVLGIAVKPHDGTAVTAGLDRFFAVPVKVRGFGTFPMRAFALV